ncbi:MAG: hypothetical protein ACXV2B_08410 [Halobacteriota archaeon]
MKRMQLIAVALCLIMLTTVGAGVVAAQQENPRQAGKSSIVFYDVAATDTHGKGKLQINLDKRTFEFNGQGFAPSMMYNLKATTASGDAYVFASAKSTAAGQLHAAGTWSTTAAAQPGSEGFGIVAATVFSGTLQRPTTYYPHYTLTYTDNAGQKFSIYLDPNSVTGTPALPSTFLNPVALDYVYNIDGYHYTVQFVYQGVTYSAKWVTTTHNPYLSSNAEYNRLAIEDEVFGHVYLNWWDTTKNQWQKSDAAGVLARVSYYDINGKQYYGSHTTHSGGKWCVWGQIVNPPSYVVDLSLTGYPSLHIDDVKVSFFGQTCES